MQKKGREEDIKANYWWKICLLIALEYWRENRTYFHIAKGYEIHETTAIRIVRWVEDTLISDGTFSLPGKICFIVCCMYRYGKIFQIFEQSCRIAKHQKHGIFYNARYYDSATTQLRLTEVELRKLFSGCAIIEMS